MQIPGKWFITSEGLARPTIDADVQHTDGSWVTENFLIDTGADRTVFRATLLRRLSLPARSPGPDEGLGGIGGMASHVLVRTTVRLKREDGGTVDVRGEFAAFTDPMATDMNILGQDVLEHFDLIFSHRHNEILLLAHRHHYRVEVV